MSESNLWKKFKAGIMNQGKWDRIESHDTSTGFPDSVGCYLGIVMFMELKWSNTNQPPEIRPSQVRWHRRWNNNGGRSWLLIEWGGVVMLIDGKHAPVLVKEKRPEMWMKLSQEVWLSHETDMFKEALRIMYNKGVDDARAMTIV